MLAILMMSVMAASCKNGGKNGPTDTTPQESGSGDEDTTPSAIKDSGLPKRDYSDETYVIRYATKTTFVPDTVGISRAEANKDIVSKAGYDRDRAFENLVGAEISYIQSNTNPNADSGNDSEIIAIRSMHMMGDLADIDLLMVGARTAGTMIAESLFTDLNQYDNYIKPGAYYYSKGFNDAISLGNKQFAAVGYYTTVNVGWTRAVCVNNTLLSDVFSGEDKISELYDLVFDHKWTVEALLECGENYATGNVDNDISTDKYTWVIGKNPCSAIYYGIGGTTIEKDEQGLPTVTANDSKNIDLLTYLRGVFADSAVYVAPNDTESEVFNNKNSLFILGPMRMPAGLQDSIGVEGRVLPLPLRQEGDEYISTLDAWCANVAGIPALVEDADMAAYCYEAYMALSYDYVYPEFFEKLFKLQYVNSPVEAQIFDVIANTATIGIVDMYRWTTGMRDPIRDIINGTSEVGSSAKTMADDIESHVKDFLNNYKFG